MFNWSLRDSRVVTGFIRAVKISIHVHSLRLFLLECFLRLGLTDIEDALVQQSAWPIMALMFGVSVWEYWLRLLQEFGFGVGGIMVQICVHACV